MHFFGADLRFGPQFYRRDQEAYLEEFRAWNGQCHAGEASVWYLFSKSAAAEIKAFSPDARILILLREPAEMLYSLYSYFRFDGNESLPTFAEALAAEDDRRAGRRLGGQTYFAQGLAYRRTVCYAEQVERYFAAFGRERVRVLLFDDFAADPVGACQKTLNFLELDAHRMRADFKVINGARSARSLGVQAVLGNPRARAAVLAVRPWLPRAAFTAMRNVETWLRRVNARVEPRPCLDPRLRDQLRGEFVPEVERLSRLLGRNLAAWRGSERDTPSASALPVWLPTGAFAGN